MDNQFFLAILGFVPFIVLLTGLWLYISCRTKERQIQGRLSKIRNDLRSYQQKITRLKQEASAFSPNDPDPFGELSEIFNLRMIEFEETILQIYEDYGCIHQRIKHFITGAVWKKWFDLVHWQRIIKETELVESALKQADAQFYQLILSRDQLMTLGFELSKRCREAIEQLHETRLILQDLVPSLTGTPIETCRRNVETWNDTLRLKIPVSFFSNNNNMNPSIFTKEEMIKVHRILTAAAPEISALLEKVKKWRDEIRIVSSAIPDIKKRQIVFFDFMKDLESRKILPVSWGTSKGLTQSIQARIDTISTLKEPYPIESLRDFMHSVKRVVEQQAKLQSAFDRFLLNYNELSNLWSSMELQQGAVWVSGVRKVLEDAVMYDDINWRSIDDLADFRSQFEKLDQLQSSLLTLNPTQPIHESILPELLDGYRKLFVLHQNLRPRLNRIHEHLKIIQSLHDETKEKVDRAKSILAKTLPVISSNPLLRRGAGKEPEKLQLALEGLIKELDMQEGLIEKKAQNVDLWVAKAEQALNKWLDVMANDLDDHLARLEETFQTLGLFQNIQDLVISETKEILKKIESPDRFGMPLNRPGDDPLLVAARKLWATNDDWQKVVSVERAMADIAEPVIERYKKVEKGRELLMNLVAKGDKLVPAELCWPPTAQNLELERKQFQTLEENWHILHEEPIQAIQLVGKLSDFSTQYLDLAARISQKNEKAKQEQERILDYERKLDEAKHSWLAIANKFPEYKTLSRDLEKFFVEVDKEFGNIKKQYTMGGLPYNQVLQNLRMLCRKVNEITMPAAGNQVIDINGELQKRLY